MKQLLIFPIFLLLLAGPAALASAQLPDERIEERLNRMARDTIRQKKKLREDQLRRQREGAAKKRSKFYSSLNVSAGYETNPQSSSLRKGDTFEEMLLSLNYTAALPMKWQFRGSYNVNNWQYNELTDLSTILNHTRLVFQRQLGRRWVVGFGYDGSWLHYPSNESGSYLFHKGHVFLKHFINKKTYQQVTVDNGVKGYIEAYALGDISGTLDDTKRQDQRQSAEYAYVTEWTDRLRLKLRGRYSVNDSNARYQDFYDYTAYDLTPRLTFKLTPRLSTTASVGYTRRVYKSRIITDGGHKQRDNDYVTSLGLSFAPNKTNSVDLNYAYRQSYSNDAADEYSGSSISAGWRHQF